MAVALVKSKARSVTSPEPTYRSVELLVEARRILAAVRMEKNGIDPMTGRPLDPRAVFFS